MIEEGPRKVVVIILVQYGGGKEGGEIYYKVWYRKRRGEIDSEEEVFLEYLEQFTNLLLIKHLSIKDKQEYQLTEKEKKEREILDKIVANWFYKTSQQ